MLTAATSWPARHSQSTGGLGSGLQTCSTHVACHMWHLRVQIRDTRCLPGRSHGKVHGSDAAAGPLAASHSMSCRSACAPMQHREFKFPSIGTVRHRIYRAGRKTPTPMRRRGHARCRPCLHGRNAPNEAHGRRAAAMRLGCSNALKQVRQQLRPVAACELDGLELALHAANHACRKEASCMQCIKHCMGGTGPLYHIQYWLGEGACMLTACMQRVPSFCTHWRSLPSCPGGH